MSEGVLKIPSMQGKCSPEEWQARVDLAACYRLVDPAGNILAKPDFGSLDSFA